MCHCLLFWGGNERSRVPPKVEVAIHGCLQGMVNSLGVVSLYISKYFISWYCLSAVLATSEYLDIRLVYIEKDYWITRSLKLMVQNYNAEKAIFKGETSFE